MLRRWLPGAPFMRYALVTLVAIFILFGIAIRSSEGAVDLWRALALNPAEVFAGPKPWQLVTYALLHDMSDPMHLVFNGLVIYYFGRQLEDRWGTRKIALFCFATVVGGGLLIWLVYVLGLGGATVVGASGAGTGLVIAWGLTFREQEMYLLVFRMRGITLVWITIGMEVLNAVSLSGTSAAAHFGGMATGALLYALWEPSPLRTIFLRRKLDRMKAEAARASRSPGRSAASHLRVIQGGKDGPSKDKRYLN